MPRNDDGDRPRKSWRELDNQRDRSTHRKEERPSSGWEGRQQSSQAYRSYKTQLNKLFDGGGMPDALKSRLEEAGVGASSKQRKEKLEAIKAGATPAKIRSALDDYRADFGFPDDEETLAKLLELDDAPVVLEALETIERLQADGGLKRAASLKARIKTAQMTVDDDDVFAKAKALLRQL